MVDKSNIFIEGNAGDDTGKQPELGGGPATASDQPKIAGGGYIDPATARSTAGTGDGGTPDSPRTPGKRGRHPSGCTCPKCASKPAKAQETGAIEKSVNLNGIDKVLFNIHIFLGAVIAPELILEEKEARELASAIKGVNEQYKLTLDPKQAAWIDLITACGIIYGPRGVAIYIRKSMTVKPVSNLNGATAPEVKAPPQKFTSAFDPTKQQIIN